MPAAYVASLWNVSPQSGGHELSVKHFTPRLERLNQNLHAILNGSDMGLLRAITTGPEVWRCDYYMNMFVDV